MEEALSEPFSISPQQQVANDDSMFKPSEGLKIEPI